MILFFKAVVAGKKSLASLLIGCNEKEKKTNYSFWLALCLDEIGFIDFFLAQHFFCLYFY